MKVIVVEDNPVYNDYVCNFLKKGGFDTMQAYRLSTAKKLLAKAEEDNTVLADLRLPDGEGVDLLRWMRKEGKPQPFIIMTDYAEVHTAVESTRLRRLYSQAIGRGQACSSHPLHTQSTGTEKEQTSPDICPARYGISRNQAACPVGCTHPYECIDIR